MMDRGTVGFYSKNKFEKLVHLAGFIIRMNKKFDGSATSGVFCQYQKKECGSYGLWRIRRSNPQYRTTQ